MGRETVPVAAEVVVDPLSGKLVAYVEMVTSYNPGDNFRVVASLDRPAVVGLNDLTAVPTVGDVANFTGKATLQLAVWRRMHVEQDTMGTLTPLLVSRTITAVSGRIELFPNGDATYEVTLDRAVGPDQFNGGSLRVATLPANPTPGGRYLILQRSATVGVRLLIVVPNGKGIPALGAVTLTQGDFQEGKVSVAPAAPVFALATITTDLRIAEADEYKGGTLRIGNVNYHILGNSTSGDVFFLSAQRVGAVGDKVELFQDDFSSTGHLFAQSQSVRIGRPAPGRIAGQLVYTLHDASEDLVVDRFKDGLLYMTGDGTLSIVSNTRRTITVQTSTTVTIGEGLATVFIKLGSTTPTLLVDPSENRGNYDMLSGTTVRVNNRYADAYIEPELHALDAFDSALPPAGHVPGLEAYDAYRGTTPGGPPRPRNYETDFFWSVYVAAIYEPEFEIDNDDIGFLAGATDLRTMEVTVIYGEVVRDLTAVNTGNSPSDFALAALTVAHEVGHQFDLAAGQANFHRDPREWPVNIMSSGRFLLTDEDLYFHPIDVSALRSTVHSPGR